MAKADSTRRYPQVVFQPETALRIQQGINQIANVVKPTLGPLARIVAIDSNGRSNTPELLDNGGVIVRRVMELSDRRSDPGAMLIRHALWRMHETVGDGTATTAVLYQSAFNEGLRYIAAGGNAMRLRFALADAEKVVVDGLKAQTRPVKGKAQLTRLARTLCYHEPMAALLGEIFDVIGEYGALEVRAGNRREMDREYFEGTYWPGGLFSRLLINRPAESRAVLENAAILISDLQFDDAEQFRPLLETALQNGVTALVILAAQVSDKALSLFTTEKNQKILPTLLIKVSAVAGDLRSAILEDIVALTGGRALYNASGETLNSVRPEDLGHARQVWATQKDYGIIGGKGNPRTLRQHIAGLRTRYQADGSTETRKQLQQRLGMLMGGSATLFVGADSDGQMETRRELAQRTSETIRSALRTGVVDGGGIALLNCRAALIRELALQTDPDWRAGFTVAIHALEAPFRALLTNAGYDPAEILGDIDGTGIGFDVEQGKLVNMADAGIVDASGVVQAAVQLAFSGAALALTTDVLVQHRKRDEVFEP